jgi:hypothetical protein
VSTLPADVLDQLYEMLKYARPQPYKILVDGVAAKTWAQVRMEDALARDFATGLPIIATTGEVFRAVHGDIEVVRVPDSGGRALVVDKYGRPSSWRYDPDDPTQGMIAR